MELEAGGKGNERTLGHACIVDLNSGLALVPEGR
jgi:hypothetical protein